MIFLCRDAEAQYEELYEIIDVPLAFKITIWKIFGLQGFSIMLGCNK